MNTVASNKSSPQGTPLSQMLSFLWSFLKGHQYTFCLYIFLTPAVMLLVSCNSLIGCGPSDAILQAVNYTPQSRNGWSVSAPLKQGLNPDLVAKLYHDAAELETLYGLLVIKNGQLIAEKYFNKGSVEQLSARQSVTKSFTSALVGIAIDKGDLTSMDQKMMDFFPEYADRIKDPRKKQITIRDLLQMRAGYPDEERTPLLLDLFFYGKTFQWVPHIEDFPLCNDPGKAFNYSNLSSHLLSAIVSRASGKNLLSYAREHLFQPIGVKTVRWSTDSDGYNMGCIEIYLTARDLAKFGLLYLNKGEWEGKQILSPDYVKDSLERYSEGIQRTGWIFSSMGEYFRDIGYGYQWWSARVGYHHFNYAVGHGGNLIVVLHEQKMVIVTTADPLYELPAEAEWKYEGAIIDLIGKFIDSLPAET